MPTAVAWQPWSEDTFERAKREGRPIFVNVAAGWCHWCHVMDEKTFADPQVSRLLSVAFVAIRIDADARPDLAERYAEWGWPANAILTPDAQPVTELRGYQEKEGFRTLLQGLADDNAAGRLKGRKAATIPKPATSDLQVLRDKVNARLDGYYDQRIGGWGRHQKYPFSAPVEQAFLRAHRGDAVWLDRAVQTLDGTRELIDPVWGGVFQYSVNDRWDDPHFEKIAAINAGALDNFAQAFAVTREPRFLEAAHAVRDYLEAFLTNPDGSFSTSQDADAKGRGGRTMLGGDYYKLPGWRRKLAGKLRTDQNAYADWNGLLIQALCRLHDATGDGRPLAMATAAATAVLATHRTRTGAFTHAAGDRTGLLHLRDNAAMGRALIALHQSTGDAAWLEATNPIARFLLTLQHDEGGFYAQTVDPAARGALSERRRPLEENGLAMRFLIEVGWHRPQGGPLALEARRAAERAARALCHDGLLEAEGRILGNFLLGLEWLLLECTHLDVAGPRGAQEAQVLRWAALALDWPGKTVRWSRPEDERPAGAALFACRGNACSSPITDPTILPAALRRLG